MRRRVPPHILQEESHTIAQFVLSHVVKSEEVRGVPIAKIFEAYSRYRKKQGLRETSLTVDGFGRMFPKVFPRDQMSHSGIVRKSVVGVALV